MVLKSLYRHQTSINFIDQYNSRFSEWEEFCRYFLQSHSQGSYMCSGPRVHSFLWSFPHCPSVQFKSVQSLSCVQLFGTPWTAAHQASLSITNAQSLPRLMPIESVMPSSHLILCHLLLLLCGLLILCLGDHCCERYSACPVILLCVVSALLVTGNSLPSWSSLFCCIFSFSMAWVQSLVRELRPSKPCGQKEKRIWSCLFSLWDFLYWAQTYFHPTCNHWW